MAIASLLVEGLLYPLAAIRPAAHLVLAGDGEKGFPNRQRHMTADLAKPIIAHC